MKDYTESYRLTGGIRLKNKAMWLPLFNLLILLLFIYLQFLNLFIVFLKTTSPSISHAISLVDKVILFSIFLFILYARILGHFLLFPIKIGYEYSKGLRFLSVLKEEMFLIVILSIFCCWALVSCLINGNSLEITAFGIFAHIKYFLVFFIFSSLPYTSWLIKRDYKVLLYIALLFSCISILQELLAFAYPSSITWWPNIQHGESMWRLGLFRTPSLLGHPNSIGIFALFFLTVEIARRKVEKINWAVLGILGLAVFFSMSRMAIGAAIIAAFVFIFPVRKIVLILSPLLIIVLITYFSSYRQIDKSPDFYDQYRAYAYEKSMEVFKANPLAGVGAGMYGGHISLRYNSPIYNRYNFGGDFYNYLHWVGSIEQLWLQIIGELGLFGIIFFLVLLFSPSIILYRLLQKIDDKYLKGFTWGLIAMPLLIGFYMIAFTITNSGAWLFPYFAFVGMIVGYIRRNKRMI